MLRVSAKDLELCGQARWEFIKEKYAIDQEKKYKLKKKGNAIEHAIDQHRRARDG